jgi:multidrug transporter EmrE-like cation transporter
MMIVSYLPLILLSVTLNAVAQLLLRKAMLEIGSFSFVADQILAILPRVIVNPYIIGGMISYALSIGLWLTVLSRLEVSAAYPFLSVGYIIVAIAGYLFFAENLSLFRILGIACICLGVILISRG